MRVAYWCTLGVLGLLALVSLSMIPDPGPPAPAEVRQPVVFLNGLFAPKTVAQEGTMTPPNVWISGRTPWNTVWRPGLDQGVTYIKAEGALYRELDENRQPKDLQMLSLTIKICGWAGWWYRLHIDVKPADSDDGYVECGSVDVWAGDDGSTGTGYWEGIDWCVPPVRLEEWVDGTVPTCDPTKGWSVKVRMEALNAFGEPFDSWHEPGGPCPSGALTDLR